MLRIILFFLIPFSDQGNHSGAAGEPRQGRAHFLFVNLKRCPAFLGLETSTTRLRNCSVRKKINVSPPLYFHCRTLRSWRTLEPKTSGCRRWRHQKFTKVLQLCSWVLGYCSPPPCMYLCVCVCVCSYGSAGCSCTPRPCTCWPLWSCTSCTCRNTGCTGWPWPCSSSCTPCCEFPSLLCTWYDFCRDRRSQLNSLSLAARVWFVRKLLIFLFSKRTERNSKLSTMNALD